MVLLIFDYCFPPSVFVNSIICITLFYLNDTQTAFQCSLIHPFTLAGRSCLTKGPAATTFTHIHTHLHADDAGSGDFEVQAHFGMDFGGARI